MIEILNTIISLLIELVKWIGEKFQKPDPVLILKHRGDLKKEFHSKLPQKNQYGLHCEAIIRDIKRMDSYPDIKTARKKISPWFRVEVKGLYYKGVEVFISMPEYIKRDKIGKWRFVDGSDEEGKLLAYPVGRIPYDLIEHIDWDGDEYYHFPHIYCRFKAFRAQPYESIPFFIDQGDLKCLFEVQNFRPWDKKRGTWFLKLRCKHRLPDKSS